MTDAPQNTLDIQEVLNEYNRELTRINQDLILSKVTVSTLTRKLEQVEGENNILRASIQEKSEDATPAKTSAKK